VSAPLFEAGAWRCLELAPQDAPRLQRFYEANPEYFDIVHGEPARAAEATKTFASLPPAGWRFDRKWVLGFEDPPGEMIAMADVISGLFVPQVWHLGLFILDTKLHGSGLAEALCNGLEAWMRKGGARWSRLGVAERNARAGRFWERSGYVELRKREGVTLGHKTHTIRVMVKALDEGTREEYLALVERDRPD
jgi:GNAT superfamily N-acetyltransferase